MQEPYPVQYTSYNGYGAPAQYQSPPFNYVASFNNVQQNGAPLNYPQQNVVPYNNAQQNVVPYNYPQQNAAPVYNQQQNAVPFYNQQQNVAPVYNQQQNVDPTTTTTATNAQLPTKPSKAVTTFLALFVIILVAVVVVVLTVVLLNRKATSGTETSTTAATTVTTAGNNTCPATSITWKGYVWCVRNALNSGPGPNDFVPSNVWVDGSGYLHLRITNASGLWTCGELYTNNRFSFGTFQWQLEGRLDIFDRRVVLGLFTYGPPVAGIDGTNELDIEFSRWGQNATVTPNLYYTVWPIDTNHSMNGTWTYYNQTNLYTTHRTIWTSTSVTMKSLYGFHDDDTNLYNSWTTPSSYAASIPQATAPIHMNLWVFHYGIPDRNPSNGLPVEVIFRDFKYIDPTASTTASGIISSTISFYFASILLCSTIFIQGRFRH